MSLCSPLSVGESITVLCESPSVFSIFLHCLDTLKKTFDLSFLFILQSSLRQPDASFAWLLGRCYTFQISLPDFGSKTSFIFQNHPIHTSEEMQTSVCKALYLLGIHTFLRQDPQKLTVSKKLTVSNIFFFSELQSPRVTQKITRSFESELTLVSNFLYLNKKSMIFGSGFVLRCSYEDVKKPKKQKTHGGRH